MSAEYFFRNDDVRNSLDDSLVRIQEIFINRKIPITHAVEPANISEDVVKWLLSIKEEYPDMITIMQHGYDHSIKNKKQYGEFGGDRTYDEQYEEIFKGKKLMDVHFGNLWFPAFNFPCSPYNKEAIQALQHLDFKVLNSHYNRKWSRRIFYAFGHFLKKGLLFGHHVSWNMNVYPETTIYEISMNISFIKDYLDEQTHCEFCTYEEICSDVETYLRSPFPIGILLHHRYHTNKESIDLIKKVLDYLDKKGTTPVSMEVIYKRLKDGNLQ